jgi:hypothetical protein
VLNAHAQCSMLIPTRPYLDGVVVFFSLCNEFRSFVSINK